MDTSGVHYCELGVGHRLGWDAVLLWGRLAAAATIRPLAWELVYAPSVALGRGVGRRNIYHNANTEKKVT